MDQNRDPYDDLIAWLRQAWVGLPDAPVLRPLMEERYTREEAEILAGIPFSPRPVDQIAAIKKMEPDELSRLLDGLARKGLVMRISVGQSSYFALNDSMFTFLRSSFWPGRNDGITRKLSPLVNQYYYGGFFDLFANAHVRGLRALPIEETIDPGTLHRILPYEDVLKVLDDQDYFCVTHCPCRHRKNMDPDSPNCKYSTENCLHFGSLAHYIVENGLGREITREETRRILREAADEGLVHGVSNWLKGVDTICNCCKCCCMWFESYHVLKQVGSLDASNYIARSNPETCKACGLCVKRCPMDALSLEGSVAAKNKKGQAAVLRPELCIGCGVCVHKCPTKSLVLVHRRVTADPPADPRDYTKRLMAEIGKDRAGS